MAHTINLSAENAIELKIYESKYDDNRSCKKLNGDFLKPYLFKGEWYEYPKYQLLGTWRDYRKVKKGYKLEWKYKIIPWIVEDIILKEDGISKFDINIRFINNEIICWVFKNDVRVLNWRSHPTIRMYVDNNKYEFKDFDTKSLLGLLSFKNIGEMAGFFVEAMYGKEKDD
jgi:hypothetical protein